MLQQRSTPVIPRPENMTAETLTGFGFVGIYFADIRYRSNSIRWLEVDSKSLLRPLVSERIFPIAACRALSCEVIDSSINYNL